MAWWFLFVLLSTRIGWTGSERKDYAEIFVRVLDHAKIGRSGLLHAETEAGRIFRTAGVEIRWVDCASGECHGTLKANEFVLQIVPDGKTSSDRVFGVAFLGPGGEGKFADVFFRHIEAACRFDQQNIWRMLGTVAAHELGHLLLGSHSHSDAGIMMPDWAGETVLRAKMGALMFTKEQAALIRTRIAGADLLLAGGAKASGFGSSQGLPMGRYEYYKRTLRTRDNDDMH
jgi:hypothetical protein